MWIETLYGYERPTVKALKGDEPKAFVSDCLN